MADHPCFPTHLQLIQDACTSTTDSVFSTLTAPQASTEARKWELSAIVTKLGKSSWLQLHPRQLYKFLVLSAWKQPDFQQLCDHLVGTLKKKALEELPSKWNELYTSPSLGDIVESIFHQTVNLIVYEQLLKEYFAVERSPKSSTISHGWVKCSSISNKRYEKRKEKGRERRLQFEMCLSNVAVTSEDTDFTQYSKWMVS